MLIVYDDLTNHARAYRELVAASYVARPGREAFPGDIFYIHSRMLERATHLNKELGSGSLTALPIIETTAEDISAYIPTNLISSRMVRFICRPRCSSSAFSRQLTSASPFPESAARRKNLLIDRSPATSSSPYSQFEELETFAKFGTRLDAATRKTIDHGERIRACLKQPESQPLSMVQQICVLPGSDEWFGRPNPAR